MALPPPTCAEMRAFYPVLGAMELSAELGYTTAGEDIGEQVVRVWEAKLHGVGVDFHQFSRLAVTHHGGRGGGHEFFVLVHILVPKHKIVRRKGMAITPLHAAAQVQGEHAAVRAHLP